MGKPIIDTSESVREMINPKLNNVGESVWKPALERYAELLSQVEKAEAFGYVRQEDLDGYKSGDLSNVSVWIRPVIKAQVPLYLHPPIPSTQDAQGDGIELFVKCSRCHGSGQQTNGTTGNGPDDTTWQEDCELCGCAGYVPVKQSYLDNLSLSGWFNDKPDDARRAEDL